MGHGPARRRDWLYLLVVSVGRIWLGTRADFSGDHPDPGRYRADCILLGRVLLGQVLLGQVLLGRVLLG